MYCEIRSFLCHIVRQKAIWTDGELWTSLVVASICGYFLHRDPSLIDGIREHFSDILTVSSILFGFIITTLIFYVDVANGWSKTARVRKVAHKIIDWHVWSIVCILTQMIYLIALRAVDGRLNLNLGLRPVWYGLLVFLSIYCGLQILNHVLTVWWAFRNVDNLEPKGDAPAVDKSDPRQ